MRTKPPLWYSLQAVLSWVLEEILLAIAVLWILPRFFNINIPLWGLAILMLALAAVSGIMYSIGRQTFFLRPKVAEDKIIGSEGTVVKPLVPEGYVKVQGVLWKARCNEAELQVGDEVRVVAVEGLRLVVKAKN